MRRSQQRKPIVLRHVEREGGRGKERVRQEEKGTQSLGGQMLTDEKR